MYDDNENYFVFLRRNTNLSGGFKNPVFSIIFRGS